MRNSANTRGDLMPYRAFDFARNPFSIIVLSDYFINYYLIIRIF